MLNFIKYTLCFFLLFIGDILPIEAQNYVLNGIVTDTKTNTPLIGANVYLKKTQQGTITNDKGKFRITSEKRKVVLVISFIGYQTKEKHLNLSEKKQLSISLEPKTILTEEVVIQGNRTDKNVTDARVGLITIPVESIQNVPVLFGEPDILKTIQLLPGVQSAGEGNSGYYVRGGGPDQNLILYDGATIYNASHLFGFFSIFNSDMIDEVELIKGGMPAQYGGRLSSVLDISSKQGNLQEWKSKGGIGLISSRFTIEGPLKKDTSSIIISGRRTYIDMLVNPFINDSSDFKGSGYYFYDLNAKASYIFSPKSRIELSAYYGKDVFKYKNKENGFDVEVPWGNTALVLNWLYTPNKHVLSNTSLIFTDYQFGFNAAQNNFGIKLHSGIRDYSLKYDLAFDNENHMLKTGFEAIFHQFTPNSFSARLGETDIDNDNDDIIYGIENAIYINDEFELSDRLKINAGLRATWYRHMGPFNRYSKDFQGNLIDTIKYSNFEKVQDYFRLEPRLTLLYQTGEQSSVKASFTSNYQYIHLTSFSGVSLPTDLWMPSTEKIEPQNGKLYSLGFFKNFSDNMFETSVEIYYKELENQIEFEEGTNPEDNLNDNIDNSFTFGKGKSFGIEFFVKKSVGKLNGWLGYTLSKTTRRFDEINHGDEFYAKYDRRHDLSFILNYKINEHWMFSTVFVYATGNSVTLPVSRYIINGKIVNHYAERNAYRLDDYHRMDLSISYTPKKKKRLESTWNLSIYNIYNRFNPYFIYFDNEGSIQEGNFETKAKQVSLFPILPSISWNFKF